MNNDTKDERADSVVSPSFADAVQCVQKLRDEWNQEAWNANRMFSDKANVATQIIAALKALPQRAVADSANLDALAERINTNVARMEESQKVDPSIKDLTFSTPLATPEADEF